jgi:predicted ATP-grasp superfamily ATP-dependent carboligase
MKPYKSCPLVGDVLLVASVDTVGSTRLPQVLHKAGLRVTLMGKSGLAVGRSRFIHRYLRTLGEPSEILRALQRYLRETVASYCAIILADDPLLWAAAQQEERAWLNPWFPLPLTEGLLAYGVSKIAFIQGAARAGLPVPRFQICQTKAEAQAAAASLRYPLVLKLPYGFSGSALRFVQDVSDLIKQTEEFDRQQTFLAQEFISGEVGATPVLFHHGRPVCWFSYFMLEPWPNRFAAASAVEITDHPDVEALLEGVGALTRFHGLSAIDWVRDPRTDRLLLIEFNPRPTPALYLGALAGVDFSSALREWLSDSTRVWRPQLPRRDKQKVLMFPQSLYHAVDSRWLGPLLVSWRDAPWNDPLLLLAQVRRCLSHFLPDGWKQEVKVACLRLSSAFRGVRELKASTLKNQR